jgi:hypothetical protein
MVTLNLTLDTRRARKDGTYPLVFRLRIQDKFCDIGTGFKIFKDQFDIKRRSRKGQHLLAFFCLLNLGEKR